MKEQPLNFSSADERNQWIVDNAEYFTVILRVNRKYYRKEFPTLAEAEADANIELGTYPEGRFMIYAVHGRSDTFVKVIASKE